MPPNWADLNEQFRGFPLTRTKNGKKEWLVQEESSMTIVRAPTVVNPILKESHQKNHLSNQRKRERELTPRRGHQTNRNWYRQGQIVERDCVKGHRKEAGQLVRSERVLTL